MSVSSDKGKLRGFISKLPARLSFRGSQKTTPPVQESKPESEDSGFSSSSTSSTSSDVTNGAALTRFQKIKMSFRRKKSVNSSAKSSDFNETALKSQWLRNLDKSELMAYMFELKRKASRIKFKDAFGYHYFCKKIKKLLHKHFRQEIVEGILEKIKVPSSRTPTVMSNTSRECYAIATLQTLIACPPFIQFLKNNEGNSDIYRALQSIVAQCHAQWSFIYITPLLRLLGFHRNSSECAEAFYRVLHETCLQQAFPSPVEIRTWKCSLCGFVKTTEDKHARIQLAPMMTFMDETNVAEMVKYKKVLERMELVCDECGKPNKGRVSTTCILSDIMLVTADITRIDGRTALFEPVVNLGTYDNGRSQSVWKRAGVVHYNKCRALPPSPAHISTEGHYVAVVDHGKHTYLMNDSKFPEHTRYSTEVSMVHGKPAFAIYYRADWNKAEGEMASVIEEEEEEPEEMEVLCRQMEAF